MQPDQHQQSPAPAVVRQPEPVDPDLGFDPPPQPTASATRSGQARILAVIAAGGVIGAAARYGATLLWPTVPGAFPWTTFWINVTGSGAMGLLVVLVTEWITAHPLVRPFLGTGVLGGYTTFSTCTVDTERLIDGHHFGTAALYPAATLAAALTAVWAAAALTRLAVLPRPGREGGGR